MAWALLFVASLALSASAHDSFNYDGYQVLRIIPHTKQNVKDLMTFLEGSDLDIWRSSRGPGDAADVMVSPEKVAFFKNSLRRLGLNTNVMVEDVQTLIEGGGSLEQVHKQESAFNWTQYQNLESINEWLKGQAKAHNNIATVISAGKTLEGRELLGLRIAHKTNLPIIFIEAGIHAREWISPATATWFIKQVLEGNNETLKAYEWHVFPSVNPDGYAYTQKDRMWRKNRHRVDSSNRCTGVDLNRNYPFKWRSSNAYCSETYPGTSGGSELETKGVIAYLNNIVGRTRVYISLHSYSQLLMYPWGYTTGLPQNNARFNEIAKKATTQLAAVNGTRYRYGSIANTIYTAYGNTVDYAYSVNISYPFVFELRDTGRYGFILPPKFIVPTAVETLQALTVILQEAQRHSDVAEW